MVERLAVLVGVGNEGGGNGWVIGLYGFTQAHKA